MLARDGCVYKTSLKGGQNVYAYFKAPVFLRKDTFRLPKQATISP